MFHYDAWWHATDNWFVVASDRKAALLLSCQKVQQI